MFGLIPFIAIIVMISLFLIMRKGRAKRSFIRIGRKMHLVLIGGYIALLCVGLVLAEVAEVKNRGNMPEKVNDGQLSIYFDHIIQNNGLVDTSFILDERQHTAGESLTIHHSHENAAIYIERTKDRGIVKEVIYKPLLDVNQYDFSRSVKVAKPVWRDNEMTIPKQPENFIRYVAYHDSALVNQLTIARSANFNGFSSGYQTMAVHLTVPDNVEIHLDSTDHVTFINE